MDLKSDLSGILSPENIIDNPETLSAYAKDNSLMSVNSTPDMVVRPENAEQVRKIVEYANKNLIPIIPASSSVHFHGSTLPTTSPRAAAATSPSGDGSWKRGLFSSAT